jgi:hypothetical protein
MSEMADILLNKIMENKNFIQLVFKLLLSHISEVLKTAKKYNAYNIYISHRNIRDYKFRAVKI